MRQTVCNLQQTPPSFLKQVSTPRKAAETATNANPPGTGLEAILSAGDVLCFPGSNDALTRLGAAGGYMGHVMLAASPPRCIRINTEEASRVSSLWPSPNISKIYMVRTAECKRNADEGVHVSYHYLYIDRSGEIFACGEELQSHFNRFDMPAKVEVWQSPPGVRSNLNLDVMNAVVAEIAGRGTSWSWGTAIRAFAYSAVVGDGAKAETLEEIQDSWESDLICSSLIVVFWQKYLCAMADASQVNPTRWILSVMPLLADRVLPGEMLQTMFRCGWVRYTRFNLVPRHAAPAPAPTSPSLGHQRGRSNTLPDAFEFSSGKLSGRKDPQHVDQQRRRSYTQS